jgi:two-component system sensor histidine kinase LytS
MNTKMITFAIMMGALGNVLFLISYYTGQIAPGVALDLSLIGVFIAGLYGGPTVGLTTGIIAGVLPGVMFGPLGSGGVLGLIGLPLGKALTGLTTGLLSKGFKLHQKSHASLITIPTILAAYIPEAIFTYAYFTYLLPLFLSQQLGMAVIITIMIKAIVEVTIMSIIMAALIGNIGFNNFIRAHFTKMNT